LCTEDCLKRLIGSSIVYLVSLLDWNIKGANEPDNFGPGIVD
jgi:hypothetical protein